MRNGERTGEKEIKKEKEREGDRWNEAETQGAETEAVCGAETGGK